MTTNTAAIWGLKNCDTCRKALRALRDAGTDVVLHDVRQEPVEPVRLQEWLDTFSGALVNTKSTTWRGLSEAERAEAPLDLLTRYPALMKRPVIVANGKAHLGWTAEVRTELGVA